MSLDAGGTTAGEWDVGPGTGGTANEPISDEFSAQLAANEHISDEFSAQPAANEPISDEFSAQPAANGLEDSGADFGGGSGEADINGAIGDAGFSGGNAGFSGGCFNCGQEGHMKAECPNERVARAFSGECRLCGAEGHRASDCPDAKPRVCSNCLQEGHGHNECKNPRVVDRSTVADVMPEVAWKELKDTAASEDFEMLEIKDAIAKYLKGVPETTYRELEKAFRAEDIKVYLVATERELTKTYTNMDLQGNLDRKYTIAFRNSPKPKRPIEVAGWPANPEENLERLKDAGVAVERGMNLCTNCEELGHSRKNCPQEQRENTTRAIVSCVHCGEPGHRARDCPVPRTDKFACRNCKQSGHSSKECPEPRSAEGVECKKCNEVGHFAKDCPSGGEQTCNNCDEPGHMSKECPKPRDYTRVRCSNCQQMGHGKARCNQAKVSDGLVEGNGGGEDVQQDVEPEAADDPIEASGDAPAHDEDAADGKMW